jgi:hypothetical protein
MADRERSIEAPADTVRVAVLGDSMVAAQQVPLDRTMAQVAEQRMAKALAGTGRRIEVLNFAVGGYALSQMYLALDERVWAFRPDIVIAFVTELTVPNSYRKTKSLDEVPLFILHDGQLIPDPGNRPPAGTSEQSRHWHKVLGDLHNRFRILQLARTAQEAKWSNALTWTKAEPPISVAPHRSEFMRVWPYSPPDQPELAMAWEITEALLARIGDSVREHGAEFWLIQIGNGIEEDPREAEREDFLRLNGLVSFDYASERYAAFAAQYGIQYLYLAPAMREYSARSDTPLRGFFNTRPFEGHWNEAGNAAAGEIVASELLQRSPVLLKLQTGTNGH